MRISRICKSISGPSDMSADPLYSRVNCTTKIKAVALSAVLTVVSLCNPLRAQDAGSFHPARDGGQILRAGKPMFSVGLLAGPTSGLTIKALFREPTDSIPGRSSDLYLSFNGEGYAKIAGHALQERPFPDAPLSLYLGPGVMAELDNGSLKWGLSAMIGAYFVKGPYEVLLQLMPQFHITPDRNGGYSAAVGIRYRIRNRLRP